MNSILGRLAKSSFFAFALVVFILLFFFPPPILDDSWIRCRCRQVKAFVKNYNYKFRLFDVCVAFSAHCSNTRRECFRAVAKLSCQIIIIIFRHSYQQNTKNLYTDHTLVRCTAHCGNSFSCDAWEKKKWLPIAANMCFAKEVNIFFPSSWQIEDVFLWCVESFDMAVCTRHKP